MNDHSLFYRHMADHYRKARDEAEYQSRVVWGVALDALAAIAESPYDGSGISDLQKKGESLAQTLRDLLDPPNYMEMIMRQRSDEDAA